MSKRRYGNTWRKLARPLLIHPQGNNTRLQIANGGDQDELTKTSTTLGQLLGELSATSFFVSGT